MSWSKDYLERHWQGKGSERKPLTKINILEAMRPGYPPESQRLHKGTISYWQGRIYAILDDKSKR